MSLARSIALVLAGACAIGFGTVVPAPASTRTIEQRHLARRGGGLPPWRSCAAVRQDPQKVIASYPRAFGIPKNSGPALNAGASTLRCGTTGWGYVHIKRGKQAKWQRLADMTSDEGWKDVAHQGLTKSLKDPDKITWSSSRETWCLSGKINFYEDNHYVTSHFVQTILGKDTNVVSSYPAEKQCENNSHD